MFIELILQIEKKHSILIQNYCKVKFLKKIFEKFKIVAYLFFKISRTYLPKFPLFVATYNIQYIREIIILHF